jgi:DNA-binding NarL/FixJ family response regulator
MGDDKVIEAIRLGVQGVVLKDMATTLLVRAVREVHAGGNGSRKAPRRTRWTISSGARRGCKTSPRRSRRASWKSRG